MLITTKMCIKEQKSKSMYSTVCYQILIQIIQLFISKMKIYDFSKIISQIGKGTEIDINSLSQYLSSKTRLKSLRRKQINSNSSALLLGSLANVNLNKFRLTVLLLVIQLAITISSPFLTNYIIEEYLNNKESLLIILILIILSYKTVKSVVGIVCDFCYQSLGIQCFAKLYWQILTNYRLISGKMLNLIEYDCNMLSNLPYASLTGFFGLVEILVILGLFTFYLSSLSNFTIFACIIILYLCSQALVSYFTFRYTRLFLIEKDKRLNWNINNNISAMKIQRQSQLGYNNKFLYCKILSKFITIIYPILINLYVFVIAERNSISKIEYILLILISLIRAPISQLLFTFNLMAQISYSATRIITFIKMQEGAESLLNNQSLNAIRQDQPMPQQMKNVEATPLLNKQKGNIQMSSIVKYCTDQFSIIYWIALVVIIVLVLAGKCYNYYITKHIIAGTYTLIDFMGLAYQVIITLLLYLALIVIFKKISKTLLKQLKQTDLGYQFLNRISGDITSIDRSIIINLYQTISSFTFVFSSYLYSILSVNNLYIQIGLIFFLIVCLIVTFKVNRFIMLSRREVARNQCLLKAKIIKNIIKKQRKSMKSAMRKIFECKQMGLFIQNYFMIILNLVVLVLSLIIVAICKQVEMNKIDKSILVIACLNIDFDLINIFIYSVRLQICLVSFERVLNALKLK